MSRKKILAGILITAGLFATWIVFNPRIWKGSSQKLTLESRATRGDIEVKILSTGTVQPENRLEIKSPVAGRVESVLVNEGQMVKKAQILAWMSSAERAALIDSARSQGADEVKKWEELYRPTPVVAPISGMIILKNVEAGQSFTTNDAILVMSNRLMVKAQVDETDLAQIKVGQSCDVVLDSYPDQMVGGKVSQIAFEAKTVSNVTTYIVEILPNETPAFMRSGMTASVTFWVETKKNVLIVPTEFIKYDTGKPSVLIKKTGSEPTPADVQLGASDGKRTEILQGLEESQEIVLVRNSGEKQKSSSPFSPMGGRPGNKASGTRPH